MKSFNFHYNKPESRKVGSPKLTIHYDKKCYIVDHIDIKNINIKSKHRKIQPYCVITGKLNNFNIQTINNQVIAYIS